MVSFFSSGASFALLSHVLLAADDKAEPLLVRLDPPTRAKVIMALLSLVLVGLGLMALAWLGGRYFRRLIHKPSPPTRPKDDAWYRKPLIPRDPPSPFPPDPE